MIPYDDLVIALQTWRAKQGLPVLALSGQFAAPPSQEQAQSYAPPPPPAAQSEVALDVDGANLIEEHYEAEGTDYSHNFNQNDEQTSIGNIDDESGRGGGGQNW